MERRAFLAMGSVAVAGTVGYVTTESVLPTRSSGPAWAPAVTDEGHPRGQNDRLIHERGNFDDDEDILEYGDESVKIATVVHDGEPQQTTTLGFETWAEGAGSRLVHTPLFEYAIDVFHPGAERGRERTVNVVRRVGIGDWDGWYFVVHVRDDLGVPFPVVVAHVPRTATATVELGSRTHTHAYPVYAHEFPKPEW